MAEKSRQDFDQPTQSDNRMHRWLELAIPLFSFGGILIAFLLLDQGYLMSFRIAAAGCILSFLYPCLPCLDTSKKGHRCAYNPFVFNYFFCPALRPDTRFDPPDPVCNKSYHPPCATEIPLWQTRHSSIHGQGTWGKLKGLYRPDT